MSVSIVDTIFSRVWELRCTGRTCLCTSVLCNDLFSVSRHGVAAKELERQLDIPYKTAWRMAHEIRKYMAEVDGEHPLDGEVEADETYVGGKRSGGKRGRGAPNKTVVLDGGAGRRCNG